MKGFRKILIAMNGSAEVLRHGLNLAKDEKCWVTVVKVVPAFEGDLCLTGIKNVGDVVNGAARGAVSEIKNLAEGENTLVKVRVEDGEIHKKIVEVAEEEHCDLIVMGARKSGWLKRLFNKGIAEQVILNSPCPVLVVNS